MLKEHTLVIKFELPSDMPREYEQAIYAAARAMLEDFRGVIDSALVAAGYEGRTVVPGRRMDN